MPAGTRSPFHRLQRFPVGSVQPDLMSVHDDRAVNKFPILHPVCRSAVFRQSIDRASVVADDPFHSERLFRPLRERGRVLRGQVELCEYAYDDEHQQKGRGKHSAHAEPGIVDYIEHKADGNGPPPLLPE